MWSIYTQDWSFEKLKRLCMIFINFHEGKLKICMLLFGRTWILSQHFMLCSLTITKHKTSCFKIIFLCVVFKQKRLYKIDKWPFWDILNIQRKKKFMNIYRVDVEYTYIIINLISFYGNWYKEKNSSRR